MTGRGQDFWSTRFCTLTIAGAQVWFYGSRAGKPKPDRSCGCVGLVGDADAPVALYDYWETRHHVHPEDFSKGFKGYIHTDGYAGYYREAALWVTECIIKS